MKRLVMNADDFGLCRGVNLGILRAYRQGVVTSATLMVNMPGAADAYAMAAENPGLGVGLHIALTAGRPVAEGVESLIGPNGRFLKLDRLRESARPGHLLLEVEAQVRAFLASGLSPTHLDSHHHVHREIPAVAEAMLTVAARLGIPIRQFSTGFSDAYYGRDAITVDALRNIVQRMPDGLCEIMCHPGCVDGELPQLSSYVEERELELATLTDSRVRSAIDACGFRLVNYRDVQRMDAHG